MRHNVISPKTNINKYFKLHFDISSSLGTHLKKVAVFIKTDYFNNKVKYLMQHFRKYNIRYKTSIEISPFRSRCIGNWKRIIEALMRNAFLDYLVYYQCYRKNCQIKDKENSIIFNLYFNYNFDKANGELVVT